MKVRAAIAALLLTASVAAAIKILDAQNTVTVQNKTFDATNTWLGLVAPSTFTLPQSTRASVPISAGRVVQLTNDIRGLCYGTGTQAVCLGDMAVNVRDHGAMGDGASNDAVGIAAAITAAPTGGTLIFPCGTYLINSTVNVSKRLTLRSTGERCAIIRANVNNINTITATADGVSIIDLTIEGDGTTSASSNGSAIYFSAVGDGHVENCRIANYGQGGIRYVNGADTDQNFWFIGNHFESGVDNAGTQHDISVDGGGRRMMIAENRFIAATSGTPIENAINLGDNATGLFREMVIDNNIFTGAYTKQCISIADNGFTGTAVRDINVSVTNNQIQNCLWAAIKIKNVPRSIVTGNRIEAVNSVGETSGLDGAILLNGSTQSVVANNVITDSDKNCIQVSGQDLTMGSAFEHGHVIANNVCQDSGEEGIELGVETRNASVTGNTVVGCGGAGLNVVQDIDSRDLSFTGNTVRGCIQGFNTIGDDGVSTDRPQNVTITGNTFAENLQVGANIQGLDNVVFVGNVVTDNSMTTPNASSGVALGSVTQAWLAGNRIGNTAQTPVTFTADAGTDVVTAASGGWYNGEPVVLTTTTTLPAGLALATTYWVVNATTPLTFKLAATSGGAAINITDAGTGTHSLRRIGQQYGINFAGSISGIYTIGNDLSGNESGAVSSATATGVEALRDNVGQDAVIKRLMSATASLDFGATAAQTCDDLTITVTGAVDGDVCSVGVPNALASVAGSEFTCFISSANTAKIRRCNVTTAAFADPAAATIRAQVAQH